MKVNLDFDQDNDGEPSEIFRYNLNFMVYIFIVIGVYYFFFWGGGRRIKFVEVGGYHISMKFTHPSFIKSRNKNLLRIRKALLRNSEIFQEKYVYRFFSMLYFISEIQAIEIYALYAIAIELHSNQMVFHRVP